MEYRQHLNDKEKAYNKICGVTMTNIFTLTKNCDVIPVRDVDIKNKEDLYVLSVAAALGGAIDKKVSVNGSAFYIWRLNRRLGLKKDCRIERMLAKDTMYSVSPRMMNRDMRIYAGKETGEEPFNFGNIFDEFYERKKK